jgi:hypothetical protein
MSRFSFGHLSWVNSFVNDGISGHIFHVTGLCLHLVIGLLPLFACFGRHVCAVFRPEGCKCIRGKNEVSRKCASGC